MKIQTFAFLIFFAVLAFGQGPEEDWKNKSDDFWKARLTETQFRLCREKGSERPFTGKFYKVEPSEKGVYHCALCGQELFSTDQKFLSMGYASFWQPLRPDLVELKPERKFFISRTEVVCKRCGAHLGYVYDDGPGPTGKRYAIKSACLDFISSFGVRKVPENQSRR